MLSSDPSQGGQGWGGSSLSASFLTFTWSSSSAALCLKVARFSSCWGPLPLMKSSGSVLHPLGRVFLHTPCPDLSSGCWLWAVLGAQLGAAALLCVTSGGGRGVKGALTWGRPCSILLAVIYHISHIPPRQLCPITSAFTHRQPHPSEQLCPTGSSCDQRGQLHLTHVLSCPQCPTTSPMSSSSSQNGLG